MDKLNTNEMEIANQMLTLRSGLHGGWQKREILLYIWGITGVVLLILTVINIFNFFIMGLEQTFNSGPIMATVPQSALLLVIVFFVSARNRKRNKERLEVLIKENPKVVENMKRNVFQEMSDGLGAINTYIGTLASSNKKISKFLSDLKVGKVKLVFQNYN